MNESRRLPFDASLDAYAKQADQLLAGWRTGDADAIEIIRHHHPQFLGGNAPWLPKEMTEAEVRAQPFDLDDARLTLARWYNFADWGRLAEYVAAVTQEGSPVALFEAAVEAVIHGDATTLAAMLRDHPELVHARSTRATPNDPPAHAATLLHYLGSNGVEGYRQMSPKNAVEIAKLLLDAGAEVDALASLYRGGHTTMSMLVSSTPPYEAGVQTALAETLLDYGAAVEGAGTGNWVSPLKTALAFGFIDTARMLVRRGARVISLPDAAGLGLVEDARRLLPEARALERHRATALAAQMGHADVLRMLLDAGEDPNRYNPEGNHGHSTPLHQAALAGHAGVVRLLVERGANLHIKDTIWEGTPRGWAEYGGRPEIAEFLRTHGG